MGQKAHSIIWNWFDVNSFRFSLFSSLNDTMFWTIFPIINNCISGSKIKTLITPNEICLVCAETSKNVKSWWKHHRLGCICVRACARSSLCMFGYICIYERSRLFQSFTIASNKSSWHAVICPFVSAIFRFAL